MLVPTLFAQQLSMALLLGIPFALAVADVSFQLRKRLKLAQAGTGDRLDETGDLNQARNA
ncbi:hypothetical protein RN04_00095 [Arthrobacter sp. W1]|nr:hypothetical protein RN04_00095 [Arthrobacter sp. W1]